MNWQNSTGFRPTEWRFSIRLLGGLMMFLESLHLKTIYHTTLSSRCCGTAKLELFSNIGGEKGALI